MFERSLKEKGIRCKIMKFSSIASLMRCVELGIGISICPKVRITKQNHGVKELPMAPLQTSVVMIKHVDKWCSPLLNQYMEIIRSVMKD